MDLATQMGHHWLKEEKIQYEDEVGGWNDYDVVSLIE